MALRYSITFQIQPGDWSLMSLAFNNSGSGYSHIISRTFVPGQPANHSQIQIGPTIEATLENLLLNLQQHQSDGVIVFASELNRLLIDFNPPGNYTYVEFQFPVGSWIDAESYEAEVPELLVVNPIEIENLGIVIIDTENNDRHLIDEITSDGSPTLSYTGSDDIFSPLFNSTLKFNLKVDQEGSFLHMLTADEKRYKVQLFNVPYQTGDFNTSDLPNMELIWQGYLLPDLFKEPYKTGVIFSDFEAVDMIGLLKNVYLPSWVMNNKMPVMQLLGMIMEKTGIVQPFLVAPSLLQYEAANWKDINVPLSIYVEDDGEVKDCYKIVSDIMKSMMMSLFSYNGYWMLIGVSRKHEETIEAIHFLPTGVPAGNAVINQAIVDAHIADGSASLSGIMPLQKMIVSADVKERDSILSKDVVQFDRKQLQGANMEFLEYSGTYTIGHFDNFIKNSEHISVQDAFDHFEIGYANLAYSNIAPGYYNNYWECREHPWIYAGVGYEFNLKLELRLKYTEAGWVTGINLNPEDNLQIPIPLNEWVQFQLIVNNTEVAGNRIGFEKRWSYQPNYSWKSENDVRVGTMIFDFSFKFVSPVSGPLVMRIIEPNTQLVTLDRTRILNLKATQCVLQYVRDLNNQTTATRAINSTAFDELELPLSATKNPLIRNSFGKMPCFSSQVEIPVTLSQRGEFTLPQYIKVGTGDDAQLVLNAEILLVRYHVAEFDELFKRGYWRNLFVRRANGKVEPFDKVACRWFFDPAECYMVFSVGQTGFPDFPDDWKHQDDLQPGDQLFYYKVNIPAEQVSMLDDWKVYGSEEKLTYEQAVAKIMLQLRSKTSFVLEGEIKTLVLPLSLYRMVYMSQLETFVPYRLTLNLSNNKTTITSSSNVYQNLNDINYA